MAGSLSSAMEEIYIVASGVLLKILYWAAVLAISLALVVALVLFFESRDPTSVDGSAAILLGLRLRQRPMTGAVRRT
jgi:hypothetical protein